jgi:hypothetical protein
LYNKVIPLRYIYHSTGTTFLHGPVEKKTTHFRITYLNTLISKVQNVHAKRLVMYHTFF